MRVLQLGNYGVDGGGISSVLHEFSTWSWPRSTHDFVDTYATDPRLFGLRRLLAASRVLLKQRANYDVAHIHSSQRGSFVREGALVLLAAALRYRVVVTVHGSGFVAFASKHPHLVKSVLRRSDAIAVLSEGTQSTLERLGLSPVVLVPNGVAEPAGIGPRPPFDERHDVVFAGELSTRKGIDVLLQAWAAVSESAPEARLMLFGEVKDHFADTAATVVRNGRQPRPAVRDAIARARVLVLPSRAEAFPMAVLEAMAAGIPIVATDVGGVGKMLGDDRQVIPVADAEALTAGILRYLEDAGEAEAVGSQNLSRYREVFSPDAVMERYEGLYEPSTNQMLAARPHPRGQ